MTRRIERSSALLIGALVAVGLVLPAAQASTAVPYRIAAGLDGSLYADGGVTLGDRLYWAVAPTTQQQGLSGIWTSNGTESGTRKLVNLKYAGPPVRLGEGFVFIGDDGVNGSELWKSDGTAAGTSMVADLDPDTGTSEGTYIVGVVEGAVFLSADDGTHGQELYRYTGSGTPQLFDLNTTPKETDVEDLKYEWRSQWADSGPGALGTDGDVLYFTADDTRRSATFDGWDWHVTTSGNGRELWKVSATGDPVLVKNITPDEEFLDPSSTAFDSNGDGRDTAVLNGSLYFLVRGLKPELWRTNGTPDGTVRVSAALPVYWDDSRHHYNFTPAVAGNKLFYSAWTQDTSYDGMWATTGSGNGSRVSPAGDAGDPVPLGSKVVFSLEQPGMGIEPWVSDGTSSTLLKDIKPGAASSVPFPFTTWAGNTYFGAGSSTGRDLWRTDGTPAGTTKVHDLPNTDGAVVDGPIVFTPAQTVLYFWNSPDNSRHAGNELWAFDPNREPPQDRLPTTMTVNVATGADVRVNGQVTPNKAGQRVRLTVKKLVGGKWVAVDSKSVSLTAKSRYVVRLQRPRAQQCQVVGRYPGDATHLPSGRKVVFYC